MGTVGRGFLLGVGATIAAVVVLFALLVGIDTWNQAQHEQRARAEAQATAERRRIEQEAAARVAQERAARIAARRCETPELIDNNFFLTGLHVEGGVWNTCNVGVKIRVEVQPLTRTGAPIGEPIVTFLDIPANSPGRISQGLVSPRHGYGEQPTRIRTTLSAVSYY